MDWIRAIDLDLWANSLDARASLPKLVRRLIHATTDNIVRIELPADEEVQRHGFDGVVETSGGTAFVPSGLSVWEMGAGDDPRGKAERDFTKRSEEAGPMEPVATSFVFVTPRDWTDKAAWVAEKKNLGTWKDVRVLDSSSLAEWLESAPSVAIWLATRLGKRPAGVNDVETHWHNLAAITTPTLKPAVFLTSRTKHAEILTTWLKSEPSSIALESSSPFDVLDFFAACLIEATNDAEMERTLARAVVVEELEAWRTLAISPRPLVLLQHPRLTLEPEAIVEAVRHRHHVLLCSHRFVSGSAERIELPRVFRDELLKALEECGFTHDVATRAARESGGSLSALKRRLAKVSSNSFPRWCEPNNALELAPLLLVGAWDDSVPADQTAVAAIAGRPYHEVVAMAQAWSIDADPPICRIGHRWHLVSREDSWQQIAKSLAASQLDAFQVVAVDVLGSDDPKFELPPDDRWIASLHGKVLEHSATLREALADTIALLGARNDALDDADAPRASALAVRLVRELLPANAPWVRWASLSRFLPKLAEAAPEALLKAMETDLAAADPQIPKLLPDSGDPLFSACLHAGVLWSLECLTWAPGLLSRVSLVLARLAELDPGGRWSNRPNNTLRELFLPWHPQVGVTVHQRFQIIDLLLKRHSDVTWKLLLQLLPTGHDIALPTHRPYWRDWALDSTPKVTTKDYWEQVVGMAERLVDHCDDKPERLQALVERINSLPSDNAERLIERLSTYSTRELPDGDRQLIWHALQDALRRNQKHQEADWALSAETLESLADVCAQFEPKDSVSQVTRVFMRWPRLFDHQSDMAYEERERRLRELRVDELRRLYAEGGFSRVLQLVEAVENPWIAGYLLAESALVADETTVLPAHLTDCRPKACDFAIGFACRKFQLGGWDWVNTLSSSDWTSPQLGELGRVCPFGSQTWDWVEQRGSDAKSWYWSRVDPRGEQLTPAEIERAVRELKTAERPWTVVFLLGSVLHEKKTLGSDLLCDALETVLHSSSEEAKKGWQSNHARWELQELVGQLQNDETADEARVAAIEWALLPLLDKHSGASPKKLHRWLQTNPKAFAELMSFMSFPKHAPREERKPPSPAEQARGRHAYELLDTWHTLPGTRADGSIDGAVLGEWITGARSECGAIDRLEVGDHHIGQLLAYAPADEDGTWPCRAVRDAIEAIDSEQLLSGLHCGIANKRGVTSRSPKDGGKQERELAAQFIRNAEAIEIEWPKTGSVLRSVAASYESEARMHDEDIDDF